MGNSGNMIKIDDVRISLHLLQVLVQYLRRDVFEQVVLVWMILEILLDAGFQRLLCGAVLYTLRSKAE